MLDILSSIFSAIAGFFGYAKSRQDLENTPGQQANAQAKQIQADKTQAVADINNPDLTNLRNDVSE